ncbi:hypothetical protein WISP_83104 [Willisornis vidua]|uniref:Uncharacterized protein n=1 Tax=Willisornis vidua TaxID=1566151 RepID=A0ABQ9D3X3_9PASS|nr:hypothetical protein WISP_83104 [Willisornis vidua]
MRRPTRRLALSLMGVLWLAALLLFFFGARRKLEAAEPEGHTPEVPVEHPACGIALSTSLSTWCGIILLYHKQVTCLVGVPILSICLKIVPCPSGHKDLDVARGARAFETLVGVWERGAKPSILVCREMLGTSPAASSQRYRSGFSSPFSVPIVLGRRLAHPQMTSFHGLLSWGLGEESPDWVAIYESVG